jgi:hypothetical protein
MKHIHPQAHNLHQETPVIMQEKKVKQIYVCEGCTQTIDCDLYPIHVFAKCMPSRHFFFPSTALLESAVTW